MMNLSGMGAAGEHLQGILAGLQGPEGIRFSYIKNDGFCIKNGDFNANIKGMRHGQKLVSTPAVPAAT